jgi:hypothetical protein
MFAGEQRLHARCESAGRFAVKRLGFHRRSTAVRSVGEGDALTDEPARACLPAGLHQPERAVAAQLVGLFHRCADVARIDTSRNGRQFVDDDLGPGVRDQSFQIIAVQCITDEIVERLLA